MDMKRAGRSAQWWRGSGLGARACPPARSGAAKGPGGRGGSGDSLSSAVFQGAPVYDACCRGLLPHHPARGEHRETPPSCDEDPLRPFAGLVPPATSEVQAQGELADARSAGGGKLAEARVGLGAGGRIESGGSVQPLNCVWFKKL